MCAASNPGAFTRQDGQILVEDTHPREQWDDRCPPEWEGYSIRAAWREGEPRYFRTAEDVQHGAYARYHEPSDMMLIAEFGFITTAVRVSEADGLDDEVSADE